MQYFVIRSEVSTSGKALALYKVPEPSIDGSNRYPVKEGTPITTTLVTPNFSADINKFSSWGDRTLYTFQAKDLTIGKMKAACGYKSNDDYAVIKEFISVWDKHSVDYIAKFNGDSKSATGNGNFTLKHHEAGCWTVTRRDKLINRTTGKLENTISDVATNAHRFKYKLTSSNLTYRTETVYDISLDVTNKVLAKKNDWELGSLATGSNSGSAYCFYCTDYTTVWGNARVNRHFGVMPAVNASHASRLHSCTKHGLSASYSNSVSDSSASSGTTYDPYDTKLNGNKKGNDNGIGIKHLEWGTKGEYVDGVATVPFVMMEFLTAADSQVGSGYAISMPCTNDSFVSLTHERNMYDGYNTFQIQLFDKDALQVESKLLLGFRYIFFYYTDFVSTSKRFRGEVLDYTTAISGKGLLLTLTGYTSSTTMYTGTDSIPWSILTEASDYEFFYWTNMEGEYHGPVRYELNQTVYTDTAKSEKRDVCWNSSSGTILGNDRVAQYGGSLGITVNNDMKLDYCMKAPMSEKDKKGSGKESADSSEWVTFDYYYKSVSDKDKERYRPYAKLWSLKKYLEKDEYADFANEISVLGSLGKIGEKRPSDIVIMICIINRWKWKPDYIRETKAVSEIPDQISQTFVEYIKEKLIPNCVSADAEQATQYAFWFDDEGFVHFEPPENKVAKSKLYFNSKDQKDSYPLIGFVASSNGSVLMKSDAVTTMAAINRITGDTIEVSNLQATSLNDAQLSKQIHNTAEWFVTNEFTRSDKLKYFNIQNVNSVASEEDLKKELRYRYGRITKYSYKAKLDVYGCSDLTPGDLVDIYIYLGDGQRSDDALSQKTYRTEKELVEDDPSYLGNITIHHSSGRYSIYKITDTISGGKYISSLEVLKVDAEQLDRKFVDPDDMVCEMPKYIVSTDKDGNVSIVKNSHQEVTTDEDGNVSIWDVMGPATKKDNVKNSYSRFKQVNGIDSTGKKTWRK